MTEHFKLKEFLRSDTASRYKIDNKPNKEQLDNLSFVSEQLEVIRSYYNKPIFISSGFRTKELNTLLKGSKTSQHMQGLAVDINLKTKEENKMDREMQLVQMLMNMLQQQNSAKEGDSEQKEENTNNINNENVEETGNAQMEQEAQLQQIIEHIMSLPPEEQQAILEQYPELVQVMSLMQGTPTM